MTSVQHATPENFQLVEPHQELDVTFVVDVGTTLRKVSVIIDAVLTLEWNDPVLSLTAGYTGSVEATDTSVRVRLSKNSGWPLGRIEWSTAYSDSGGALTLSHAMARCAATLVSCYPTNGLVEVPRRARIHAAFDFEAGTALGVDLEVEAQTAVVDGIVTQPDYEGDASGVVLRGYVSVTPRRAFSWAQRVALVFHPRVAFGGDAFRGQYPLSYTVASKAGSAEVFADPPVLSNPVTEGVRQMAASSLRPRGASPSVYTLCVYYLQRCEVGALAKTYIPKGVSVVLEPEDVAADIDVKSLILSVAPLWRALLGSECPPEDRDAVDGAWQSQHPVEQLGAICLMLFYAFGGRRGV